jgi:hypothetical protein
MTESPDTFRSLVHAYLDGVADETEVARLEALLAGDPQARDAYLRLADLHACLAVDEALWVVHRPTAASAAEVPVEAREDLSSGRMRPATWSPLVTGPLPAAFVGLLVGLLGAGLASAYVVPRLPPVLSRQTLIDEGFESGPPPRPQGMPVQAGFWSGDFCRVVGDDQGISPQHGRRTLRLLRADYEGKPKGGSYVADLWQLVDLRGRLANTAGGMVTARLTVSHNASDFPADEFYRSSASLFALDAATVARLKPNDVPALVESSLAMSQKTDVPLDRDLRSWQAEHCELSLPAGTEFLLVRVGVAHGTIEQQREDFPGQYIDDVKLVLEVRGPATP